VEEWGSGGSLDIMLSILAGYVAFVGEVYQNIS
jgi:hypothetical protein